MKKSIIAIIVVVVLIVAGIAIFESSVPSKSQLTVNVSKVIDDHADEALGGHSGETAYILNVTISYKGSGTLDENPLNFYIVTSNGTIEADISGLFSNVTSPMQTVTLSSGQSTTGQIYFAVTNDVTFSSVYYAYDGQNYNASAIPAVSQWVSYINGVTVNTNDSNLTAIGPLIVGDYNSGTVLSLNISVYSSTFFSSTSITSVSISPTLNYKIENTLPVTVGADDTVYIIVNVTLPNSSEYTGISVNIDATTS